jgi:hypothetical protein
MALPVPVLLGTAGLALGEVFKLGPQADVIIGRSRSCEISFQRFRPWLALSDDEQRMRDQFNSAVSRRHLRVVTSGTLLKLGNLSSAGSRANGEPFSDAREFDLANGPVTIQLGQASELFRAELMDEADVDARIAALPMVREVNLMPGVPDLGEDVTPKGNPVLPE